VILHGDKARPAVLRLQIQRLSKLRACIDDAPM
jgi:hypothetical protein